MVFPVPFLLSSVASLIRCASPPDNSVEGCPRRKYERPTSLSVSILRRTEGTFSKNLTELLLGVNIGGLGTLVASLASLISFKIYSKEKSLSGKNFFITFTLLNLIFIFILLLSYFILEKL